MVISVWLTESSFLFLNSEEMAARNRAKAVSLSAAGTLGIGMPAAAIAEASGAKLEVFSTCHNVTRDDAEAGVISAASGTFEYEGKNIVVIFPDTGLRYLSTDLFRE